MNYLITGGSGSLGTAIFHYLQRKPPGRAVCYSRDWHKQAKLKTDLKDASWVRYFLGDVADKERLDFAMKGIDTVIHAAAIKDIVSCQYSPEETIKTNVIGTQNIIKVAIANNIDKVIIISTDKSVAPANVYGVSKSMAEALAVAMNSHARHVKTRISIARYGNVFGSSDSVVPLFLQQAKSKKFTITDENMTRFFLSIENAVDFIFDCLDKMQGGETFVPKMKAIDIMSLAKIIEPHAKVDFIGIRPGEKIHEILITNDEARRARDLGKIYCIYPQMAFWEMETIGNEIKPQEYTSFNAERLTTEEIKDMLALVKD